MISVEEARERLAGAALTPLGAEQVALADALGRVLAEDRRRAPHPAALRRLGDGRLCRARRRCRDESRRGSRSSARCRPGSAYDGTLGAGEAVRIFTGAPLPAGADAIVIQEDTDRDGDRRHRARKRARSARHVRARRPRFPRRRRPAQGRAAPDGARCRAGRGDEPAVAAASIAGRASRSCRPATRS